MRWKSKYILAIVTDDSTPRSDTMHQSQQRWRIKMFWLHSVNISHSPHHQTHQLYLAVIFSLKVSKGFSKNILKNFQASPHFAAFLQLYFECFCSAGLLFTTQVLYCWRNLNGLTEKSSISDVAATSKSFCCWWTCINFYFKRNKRVSCSCVCRFNDALLTHSIRNMLTSNKVCMSCQHHRSFRLISVVQISTHCSRVQAISQDYDSQSFKEYYGCRLL